MYRVTHKECWSNIINSFADEKLQNYKTVYNSVLYYEYN